MILGSHNSWSYLKPLKWWKRPFAFIAKCLDISIKEQYEDYNVRCFDLRLKYSSRGKLVVSHGFMEYAITEEQLMEDLQWLNDKGDVYLRLLFEARTKKEYEQGLYYFNLICSQLEKLFRRLKFWCGRNLYNWHTDYKFKYDPSCLELYSSVCPPKYIDDWWPRIYAKKNNKMIKEVGTTKDILLIDFVNIG